MTSQTLDERKRRLRTYLLSSLVFLIFLWIFKLSHPQFTIIPSTSLSSASATSATKAPGVSHKPLDGKWKSKPTSPHESSGSAANPKAQDISIGQKVAVIVQPTFKLSVIPLVLHFSTVLGPEWPVLIYTTAEAIGSFSASAALQRHIHNGQIQIRLLPQTVLFTTTESHTAFMTNPWIWENVAPAEYVLVFDSDSMLCANAARSLEDYFEYTFVGAPVKEGSGKSFNGGLSLRRRSAVLRVLETWDWEENKSEDDRFEDQWFYNRFAELADGDDSSKTPPKEDKKINLPSIEVSRTFAIETVDFPHPLGVHHVNSIPQDQISKLDDWCPEYKLCSAIA